MNYHFVLNDGMNGGFDRWTQDRAAACLILGKSFIFGSELALNVGDWDGEEHVVFCGVA
jgi:hypothetical protein